MSKKLIFIVFLGLLIIPLFGKLGYYPLHVWDEARLANNALEMKLNGNFFVTYYDGNPDMWNTKPPLMIWLQVLSFNIFGVSEFAIRFPSALAALFTCLLLYFFGARKLKSPTIGFLSAFVLVTTNGFVHNHISRTGDYDALLILFTTAQCLSFYLFLEEKKTKWLYFFFLSLLLAVLTKSIAGMFFLPAFFIYTIYKKEVLNVLKNIHFYFGIIAFFAIVFLFHWYREIQNPGYIQAVWNNDLGGRFTEAQENNAQSWWYYLNQIVSTQLTIWFYLIPFGIFLGLKSRVLKLKNLTILLVIAIISFICIISLSKTKLQWYLAPIFPFTALLVSLVLHHFWENRITYFKSEKKIYLLKSISFILLAVAVTAYFLINLNVLFPRINNSVKESQSVQIFLKNMSEKNADWVANSYFLHDGYDAHYRFYVLLLQQKGISISIKNYANIDNDRVVLFYQESVQEYLKEHYLYDILDQENIVKAYKIHEKQH